MRKTAEISQPELWAGMECTVNRVGDVYLDQMERNGHAIRVEDIARFADLGIKKMRYPILWERIAPQGIDKADWSWADERSAHLQQFGIQPIVGLVHHGCGPRHTSLVKPCFVEGLADFARAFAQRYPWVEYYTPVNEPLTTARFSGLYGHWYPHGNDGATFARALLNQCRAIVECMRVVREVNPAAKLVVTEDLGKTYSTPALAHLAFLDNERRWLSIDLLTGQLTTEKPMWHYLRALGIEVAELQWFLEHPCPPDIMSINHYLTSERYLDERTHLYPEWSRNGAHFYPKELLDGEDFHLYTDIEAIRVRSEGLLEHYVGHYTLLKEAWERYGLPLAITEVHIGGHREQQVVWLQHVWNSAVRLHREGIDVHAVTAWSLLGSYDWNSLVTRNEGHYESGVFDVRGAQPRPTALAYLVRHLAKGQVYQHPALQVPGWWERADRFLYPFPTGNSPKTKQPVNASGASHAVHSGKDYPLGDLPLSNGKALRPILILGEHTRLGKTFARICRERHLPSHLLDWQDMESTPARHIGHLLDTLKLWAIVDATDYGLPGLGVDTRRWANTYIPAWLAACRANNTAFVAFSSDWVFDGLKRIPYLESDPLTPRNEYGRIQAQMESSVLKACDSALVIRTGTVFDASGKNDWLTAALSKVVEKRLLRVANTPTFPPPTCRIWYTPAWICS